MKISVTDYAKESKIPRYVFAYLKNADIIRDPLHQDDLLGLKLLEKMWGKIELLRPQVAKLTRPDRQRFLKTADMPTKWERYAYSRFRNHNTATKLPMAAVIQEIESVFGFKVDQEQKQKLYKARNRAYVDRHREKVLTEQ